LIPLSLKLPSGEDVGGGGWGNQENNVFNSKTVLYILELGMVLFYEVVKNRLASHHEGEWAKCAGVK
jgi:hypothetical protein